MRETKKDLFSLHSSSNGPDSLAGLPVASPSAMGTVQDRKEPPSESQGPTAYGTLWKCHPNVGLQEPAAGGGMGCAQTGVTEQCKNPRLLCVL